MLIKIGQLAKQAGVLPSKIRFYVQEGLIYPVDRTRGGYYLFEESEALDRLQLIKRLRTEERLSINEIKERISQYRYSTS